MSGNQDSGSGQRTIHARFYSKSRLGVQYSATHYWNCRAASDQISRLPNWHYHQEYRPNQGMAIGEHHGQKANQCSYISLSVNPSALSRMQKPEDSEQETENPGHLSYRQCPDFRAAASSR